MIVWRLENHLGEGPYNCTDWSKIDFICQMKEEHGANPRSETPGPTDDGLMDFIRKYDFEPVFGFPNLKAAREWFGTYLPGLIELGFKLNRYHKVKDFKIGNSGRQLVFIKENQ